MKVSRRFGFGNNVRYWSIPFIVLMTLALVFALSPPASALAVDDRIQIKVEIPEYPQTVAPGETYTITARITKGGIPLPAACWEIRVYFYSGSSCFNEIVDGSKVEQGAARWYSPNSTTELYSGWWQDRYPEYGSKYAEAWPTPDTRDFTIPVRIVSKPRDPYDTHPIIAPLSAMEELPEPGVTIKLRARFKIKDIRPTFDSTDNTIDFYLGDNYFDNVPFTYSAEYDSWSIRGTYGYGSIGEDSANPGKYDIDFDATAIGIAVGASSGSGLPLIPIVGALVVLLVVVAVVVVLKKRGAAEVPLPPPPPPPPTI